MSLLKDTLKKAHNTEQGSSAPKHPPVPFLPPAHLRNHSNACYTPISWNQYFQSKQKVYVGPNNAEHFSVYTASTEHFVDGRKAPLIIFLHGGGHSALTWARATEELLKLIACDIMAVDLRGHGETKMEDDNDVRKENLIRDLHRLTAAMNLESRELVIVGHSLGGAVAIHFARYMMDRPGEINVVGLVVLDVVEGSAMDSLVSMSRVLKNRPVSFPSLEKAIEWSVRSGQTRNIESARVAMPGMLKFAESNEPATVQPFENLKGLKTGDQRSGHAGMPGRSKPVKPFNGSTSVPIQEDEVMGAPAPPASSAGAPKAAKGDELIWRIDLSKTEPYWAGWFEGISAQFLEIPCPKLLLLAGIDRLDRELTVGQMQGKFQMHVLHNVGHTVQEDSPEKVAQHIAGFLTRHKIAIGKVDFAPAFPGC